jgi:GTP-binding protein HflX
VTDTVGFVQDLPHWLVTSFSATLSEAAAADVVVLVVDVTDPIEELREKTRVSLDVLSAQGVDESSVVTAVNKIDTVDDATRRERVDDVRSIAPSPIPVSAREGTRLAGLIEEVIDRLPTERATLTVPNCGAAMELVSWAYDRTAVGSVSYAGTEVTIELSGRPELVEQAIAKAEDVRNC